MKENRIHERHQVQENILYLYDNNTYQGRMHNISLGGIKFEAEQLITPMTRLKVTFGQEPAIDFDGITVWSSKIGDNYSVGLIFDNLTQEQQYYLKMLLSMDRLEG